MMTTQHDEKPVLVVGGTGKTGRRVADRLRHRGVPVRIGSRSSTIPFDWEDPSGWDAALDDVGAAYISYYPDLAVPGAPEAVQALAAAALDRGVRRLVLLSGRGEIEAQRAEQIVFDSGADATVVRCAWFMQNFSEAFLLDAVQSGEIVLPGGDASEPWVDADDIADVAVAALTEPGHVGQLYEGVPEELVGFLTYLFSEVFGHNAHTADGVQRALGRPARDFATFAGAAAAAGAWDTSVPAPA